MKDITFGQYYPIDSVIHRLDARIKMLLTVLFIVVIFIVDGFVGFTVPLLFIVLTVILSKVPVKAVFKSIKPIMFLVVFTAVLNLLFYQTGEIVFELWIIKIRDEAITFSLFMAARLILLVAGSSILTLTTDSVSLTDAIESLLSPLKVVKFPVHELALIMSIALRFIPTLMDEADRIIRAQKARGADFESGNLFARAKALIPILIPLLVSSFRRADELADAMDARCYRGGVNRTKMKKFSIKANDIYALMFGISLLFFVLTINLMVL